MGGEGGLPSNCSICKPIGLRIGGGGNPHNIPLLGIPRASGETGPKETVHKVASAGAEMQLHTTLHKMCNVQYRCTILAGTL